MSKYPAPGRIRLVFFSGTGGTQMAAAKLCDSLMKRGVTVFVNKLDGHKRFDEIERADMLIVMYPVYAGNAPEPIYSHIKKHERMDGMPTGVICVSGGGEAFINKASRLHAVNLLKRKGCNVVYEKMLVMPSNAIEATPEDIALRLLKILPEKTEQIADDLLQGITRRTKLGPVSRGLAALMEIEKTGARFFGKSIRADGRCVGCAKCARECPNSNITMENGKPVVGKRCATCLHCIYSCPENALSPRLLKRLVLKEGFDLEKLELRLQKTDDIPNTKLKGIWKALNGYFEYID